MDDRARDGLPLTAWLVSLAVTIVAFTSMGGGQLAAPSVIDPGAWGGWAADRDAVVATVAVLRLVVLAMAWYLVGVTTIGAVARVARCAHLVRVADALSVTAVRRVLQASLGVGLATTVVVSTTGAVAPASPGPTIVRAVAQTPEAADTPRMRPVDLPAAPTAAAPAPAMTPLADRATPDLPPPGMRPLPVDGPAAPDTAGTVTVAFGDHLWSIAERHLGDLRGTAVPDDDVTDYWRRLVEANRDRLVDPANPDLILPGQQFVLPPADLGTAR